MASIEDVLAARGLEVASEGLVESTPGLARMLAAGSLDKYGELLSSRSFRKLLQRLSGKVGEWIPIAAIRQTCGAKAGGYVEFLSDAGLVQRNAEAISPTADVNEYGHHLEWHVATLCKEAFRAQVSWNVKLKDLLSGGDFDILLNIAGTLIYVELKSGRASGISETHLRRFLQRRVELSPDLAILIVDTDDDIGSLVSEVNRVVVDVYRTMPTIPPDYQPEEPLIGPLATVPGAHWGLRNLYFCGSHPSFVTQIRRCLRFYHEFARHQMYLGGEAPNFLTAGLRAGNP